MTRELVERAIRGDYQVFIDLVQASASRQYAIATLILRDGDRAKDAVQDALVSAWRGMSALRDPDAWDAWLHRLTVRACYAAARRERSEAATGAQGRIPVEPKLPMNHVKPTMTMRRPTRLSGRRHQAINPAP